MKETSSSSHPHVVAVSLSGEHTFAKINQPRIRLVEDRGVEGDAHYGATIKHRSRVAQDPTQPNLRQVHLIHSELFDELRAKGFRVEPGEISPGDRIEIVLPDGDHRSLQKV